MAIAKKEVERLKIPHTHVLPANVKMMRNRTNRDVAAAQVIMQRGLSSVGQTQIMLVEGKVFGGLING